METVIDNQVSVINNSIEIFKTAPEILRANRDRSEKAVAVGNSIIDQWHNAWAIEDEDARMTACAAADERSNKYLVNCGTALKEEKEARAAITQMMDLFKKMFTDAENEIDRTKPNTVTEKVQSNRDTYVAEDAKIKARKRKEADEKAAKAKESVEIKSYVEKWIIDKLLQELATKKESITNGFNHINLDNYDDKCERLKSMSPIPLVDLRDKIGTLASFPISKYHSQNEVYVLRDEVFATYDFEGFSTNTWGDQVGALKQDLIDKLPSKKEELLEQKRLDEAAAAAAEQARIANDKRQEEMAKANAATKKRLEAEAAKAREDEEKRQAEYKKQQEAAAAEQKRREAADSVKLKEEAEAARLKAEQDADIKKQGDQMMVMFDQESSLADVVSSAPESRQGYEITVLHPAGYVQLFTLWFENEGKNLPVDKIGNTKLDQMKSWAEKHAHKNGTKIEGKMLKYEESFKAVNRKVKP